MRKKLLQFYKDFYNLEELKNTEEVDFSFFKTVRKNYSFVVVAVYNSKGEFLLVRNLNRTVGWEFPGGYIQDKERVEDAVNRIVLREIGLHIDELRPVAIVKNSFTCHDKLIEHQGVAFKALARGKPNMVTKSSDIIYTSVRPKKMAFQDEKIFELAQKGFSLKSSLPPFGEISSRFKYRVGYALNDLFVKKIGKLASLKIEKKVRDLVFDYPKTILDSSCGDDSLIVKLQKSYNAEYCIANDISWEAISLIKKYGLNENIIFTNHNVQNLPLVRSFDLVLFKNTLHHIDKMKQQTTLRALMSISKQLIIIDIEDPLNSSRRAKIWNLYYRKLLGDQGDSFLSYGDFKSLIKEALPSNLTQIGKVRTIKGDYMYASIYNSSI